MNIDVVNKIVAQKLGITETKVGQVNRFFWQRVRGHMYEYNPYPVNVPHLFVLHPSRTSIKKAIMFHIKRIRSLQVSKRYSPDSRKRKEMIEYHRNILRGFWKIRKINKYTN